MIVENLTSGQQVSGSLARRSEPCWVTAAMYSSCSMRMLVLTRVTGPACRPLVVSVGHQGRVNLQSLH